MQSRESLQDELLRCREMLQGMTTTLEDVKQCVEQLEAEYVETGTQLDMLPHRLRIVEQKVLNLAKDG